MAEFLTTKQAGEILEIEMFSVSKAINRGKIHAVKFGTQWMIERDEVLRYQKEVQETAKNKPKSKQVTT
jgi:excisionase family DNA binding protein